MRRTLTTIVIATGLLVAALPYVVLILFYLYVIRVRLLVGHWPALYNPESWSVGYPVHYRLLRPWVYGFYFRDIWVLMALTASYGFLTWFVQKRFPRTFFLVLGIGFLHMLTIWKLDPGHFVHWFMD